MKYSVAAFLIRTQNTGAIPESTVDARISCPLSHPQFKKARGPHCAPSIVLLRNAARGKLHNFRRPGLHVLGNPNGFLSVMCYLALLWARCMQQCIPRRLKLVNGAASASTAWCFQAQETLEQPPPHPCHSSKGPRVAPLVHPAKAAATKAPVL